MLPIYIHPTLEGLLHRFHLLPALHPDSLPRQERGALFPRALGPAPALGRRVPQAVPSWDR